MSDLIPPGKYPAVANADGADFGVSEQKGTDYVFVPFTITRGEWAGVTLGWRGYFTEKTENRTSQSLMHAGCTFPTNDVTDLTGLGSKEVEIVVEHEEYEKDGEMKTAVKIAWVNKPMGISEAQRMDDGKKKAFGARLRGTLAQVKQEMRASTPNGGGRASNSGRSTAPATGARRPVRQQPDDDIPF